MRKNSVPFLIIIAILIIQSCRVVKISNEKYPPATDPDKIEIFYSKLPNKEYVELAHVSTLSRSTNRLKIKSAKIGANAVVEVRLMRDGLYGIAVRWK